MTMREQLLVLILLTFGSVALSFAYSLLLPEMSPAFLCTAFILLGSESFFTNIFFRNKYEFRFYSIVPNSYRNLFMIKNISSFVIFLFLMAISFSLLILLNKIKLQNCLDVIINIIPTIIALNISGNFISVIRYKAMMKKFLWLFLLMHYLIASVIISTLFIATTLLHSIVVHTGIVMVLLFVYAISYKHYVKLLVHYKFKLLERP